MAFNALMFLYAVANDYSLGVFNVLVAVWFMAVGYLLVKNVNRRMHARAACLSAEAFLDASHERALQRG